MTKMEFLVICHIKKKRWKIDKIQIRFLISTAFNIQFLVACQNFNYLKTNKFLVDQHQLQMISLISDTLRRSIFHFNNYQYSLHTLYCFNLFFSSYLLAHMTFYLFQSNQHLKSFNQIRATQSSFNLQSILSARYCYSIFK